MWNQRPTIASDLSTEEISGLFGPISRYYYLMRGIMDPSASSNQADPATVSSLLPLVYAELHSIAEKYLRKERSDHTLQPTALVHEAYMRLRNGERKWPNRAHFLAVAAVAMRNVLVDHARRHVAEKRGANAKKVTLGDTPLANSSNVLDVLELDDLLQRLAALDARRARVVELKVFAAMTNHEIADVLGVARSTVADDWTVAKAWLAAELSDAP